MSNKKWECEIIAPPELHKPIQELFDAISWKLKHAESSSAQIATDINVGDTIYRQAAIDAMNGLPKWSDGSDNLISAVCLDYSDVISVLSDTEKLPSAQPQRKMGKWIGYNAEDKDWQRNDGSPIFLSCSECNGTVMNNGSAHWNYCPSCGARMEGENE